MLKNVINTNDINVKIQTMIEDIDKIADISKSNSDSTQNVAASSEEQAALMKEVARASHELVTMSEELKYELQFFKL